jgi:hypothetical protein
LHDGAATFTNLEIDAAGTSEFKFASGTLIPATLSAITVISYRLPIRPLAPIPLQRLVRELDSPPAPPIPVLTPAPQNLRHLHKTWVLNPAFLKIVTHIKQTISSPPFLQSTHRPRLSKITQPKKTQKIRLQIFGLPARRRADLR